jgi:hypothetical protein
LKSTKAINPLSTCTFEPLISLFVLHNSPFFLVTHYKSTKYIYIYIYIYITYELKGMYMIPIGWYSIKDLYVYISAYPQIYIYIHILRRKNTFFSQKNIHYSLIPSLTFFLKSEIPFIRILCFLGS